MPFSTFSHWDHLIERSDATPMGFYRTLEEAIERRKIPDSSRSRTDYREGGLLCQARVPSSQATGATRSTSVALHSGRDFFVSWWLSELTGCVRVLGDEFAPEFSASDLMNLPNCRIYLRLLIDGVVSKPFRAETLLPPYQPRDDQSRRTPGADLPSTTSQKDSNA